MPKIYEYDLLDKEGQPVGPKQRIFYDTDTELADKLRVAHQNVSAKLYEVRLANKLGTLMEPDPEQPVLTFEPRPLSADERVRIDNLMKDPNSRPEAYRLLLEAELGAPLEGVRKTLRSTEENNRIMQMRYEIEAFKAARPEYVETEPNRDKLIKYLEKNKWPLTKKNLEIAFEELTAEGLLTVQAPEPEPQPQTEPEPTILPAAATIPPAVENVPPVQATIPPAPTAPTPISEPAAEVRQAAVPLSSSGLTREQGGASRPPEPPKTKGITRKEIMDMPAEEYGRRLRTDPKFAKDVEELLAKK